MKICRKCGIEKDESGYYQYRRVCKKCVSAAVTKRQKKERGRSQRFKIPKYKYVFSYLKSHPCVDCRETDPVVLSFDHVRGKKISNISTMISRNRPLELIKEEIKKCDVRCANCHTRKTATERGYYG